MGAVAPFVVIEQVLIDKEKWLDFWEYFEGKGGQVAGVELLYEHIKLASPTLLARNAEWMETYRDSPPAPEPEQPKETPRWPLSKEQLGQIMLCSAGSLPDSLMDDLADCFVTFLNSSRVGLAYFLGQCGHESAGLRYPLEIASGAAYNGRTDLGNVYPGDGEKFKGCGWIQVTGRNWAQQFSDQRTSIGKPDPKIMDVGSTHSCDLYPWSISGFWWQANDMAAYCEQMPDVDRVGQRVNGRYLPNGYEDRRAYTDRAFKVLGV